MNNTKLLVKNSAIFSSYCPNRTGSLIKISNPYNFVNAEFLFLFLDPILFIHIKKIIVNFSKFFYSYRDIFKTPGLNQFIFMLNITNFKQSNMILYLQIEQNFKLFLSNKSLLFLIGNNSFIELQYF